METNVFIFICICYVVMAYGACNVIAFSEGPFHIFSRIRELAYEISEHFAKMFTCMMCLPANFGWICSIFNWFFIPIPFTPFNLIFRNIDYLWWLAALCDGAFTTGIVYLMYVINDYIEKRIDFYEQNIYRDETNTEGYDIPEEGDETFIVEDITIKNKRHE